MRRPFLLWFGVVGLAAVLAASVGPCATNEPAEEPSRAPAQSQPSVTTGKETEATNGARRRAITEPDVPVSAAPTEPPDEESFPNCLVLRVVAAATGKPVAGVRTDGDCRNGVSDANGRIRLRAADGTKFTMSLRASGFLPRSVEVTFDAAHPEVTVELSSGAEVPIEVVRAEDGAPIPGARVEFEIAGPLSFDPVHTDETGRAVAILPPGKGAAATASARGRVGSSVFVRTVALEAPQPSLRIELARGGTLRAVVRDPDGQPVEGAWIEVHAEDDELHGSAAVTGEPSSADGSYEVSGLVFGRRYRAIAGQAAYDSKSGDSDRYANSALSDAFQVTPERPEAFVDLRIRRQGTLTVAFEHDAGDDPGRVHMSIDGDVWSWASIGSAGNFRDRMDPGRYRVRVWAEDRIPFDETIDVPEGAEVKRTLRLVRGASVSGIVVDEEGEPVARAFVGLPEREGELVPLDDAPPRAFGISDDEGRFVVPILQPGAVTLSARPPFDFEETTVTGISAPSENVRIAVARRGVLTLRVVPDDDGRLPADARIRFSPEAAGEPGRMDRPLPADGSFEMPWPSNVRGPVEIAVDGFVPVTREAAVPPGATVDLGEVRVRRAVRFAGTLRSAKGAPAKECEVIASAPGRRVAAETDDSGRFSFDGFGFGRVRLLVPSQAHAFEVTLPAGPDLVFALPAHGVVTVVAGTGTDVSGSGRGVVLRDTEGRTVATGETDAQGRWSQRASAGRYTVEVAGAAAVAAEVPADDLTLVRIR